MKRKSKSYTVNIEYNPDPDVSRRLAELYDKLLAMPSDEQLTSVDTVCPQNEASIHKN